MTDNQLGCFIRIDNDAENSEIEKLKAQIKIIRQTVNECRSTTKENAIQFYYKRYLENRQWWSGFYRLFWFLREPALLSSEEYVKKVIRGSKTCWEFKQFYDSLSLYETDIVLLTEIEWLTTSIQFAESIYLSSAHVRTLRRKYETSFKATNNGLERIDSET